ncbi:MAG: hypothetical protein R6U96_10255 [Promethearchaeia archaeon]
MTSEKKKDDTASVLRKHPDEMEFEEMMERLYAREQLFSGMNITDKGSKSSD